MDKEKQDPGQRFRKPQISRLTDELAMAIINNRPASVVQNIRQKLQQLLQSPARDIQHTSKQSEQDRAVNITFSDVEDTEKEEEKECQDSESSAKTIRALLAIVRMLTESRKLSRVATMEGIYWHSIHNKRKGSRSKNCKLSPALCSATHRRQPASRTSHSVACAVGSLANTIATISGFSSLVRRLSITSKNDHRALHLTASGMYDTFHGQWDIPADGGNWITNSNQAGQNKSAVFGAFLNTTLIASLMDSYGLQFVWRVIFVNKWTVRLLGKAKPSKSFVKSNYEAKKKGRTNTTKSTPAMEMSSVERSTMQTQAQAHALQVKDLTSALRTLRRKISQLEQERMDIGRQVRGATWDPGSADYLKLKKVRQTITTERLKAIKLEKTLASARSSLYSLNKALRATSTITTSKSASLPGEATEGELSKENYVEKVRFMQHCCLVIP